MKKIFLVVTVVLFFTGCNEDDVKQPDELETKKAVIYYYFDAGFGTSQCDFVIETEKNEIFIPKAKFDLSEFMSSDGSNIKNNVEITYRLTTDKVDRCFHKDGFLEQETVIIEVTEIEKE